MKIKVMYHTRGGNTKKIAEAIAQTAGHTAESVPPAYPDENIKLVFLGAGIYAGKIDPKMQEYIQTLDTGKVKNVALFGTAGSPEGGIQIMRQLLESKGINVLPESFVCPGKFFLFFNRKRPSSDDLKNAQDFAKKAIEAVEKV
ncbi:flavodoxin [Anaerobacterium chartisolvens]|uniref:Flavodoxin n=1 Tax=Anaerobacterium chartisolvens TaxID=1297424 RepID=A0A369B589_9FIRM|nr:flavodoxin domain-containing protein [Anaerobacterium chartisolvens]RCX14854.1 flavodoxin [Anaerobacterium chartisolvens]